MKERATRELTNKAGMKRALSLAPIARVKHTKHKPKLGVKLNARPLELGGWALQWRLYSMNAGSKRAADRSSAAPT